MDGILLQSVEGLGHSPFAAEPAEIWERLQEEKEEVSRDLLAQGAIGGGNVGCFLESEAAEEYALETAWRRRRQLEGRLRAVSEAQDRLIEGNYGRCTDCADEIDNKRLASDPAVFRCQACERSVESENMGQELFSTHSIH
jgi:RNA polymerase-binding transcription factor DksA